MLLADRFAIIHIPKTGGTWVTAVIEKYAPPEWHVRRVPDRPDSLADAERGIYRGHHSVNDVEIGERQAIAFIRNPWDWYVSWWKFWLEYKERLVGEPERENERWMMRLMESKESQTFEGCTRAMLAHEEHTLHAFVERQTRDGVLWGRFEDLRSETMRVLTEVGCPPSEQLAQRILHSPAVQTSSHKLYFMMYTPELRDLVAEAEHDVIARFGYRCIT